MGSGDPSGLQNRRELASLALVSSTLTRFRHICFQWFETKARRLPTSWRVHLLNRPRLNGHVFPCPSVAGKRTFSVPFLWSRCYHSLQDILRGVITDEESEKRSLTQVCCAE